MDVMEAMLPIHGDTSEEDSRQRERPNSMLKETQFEETSSRDSGVYDTPL